MNKWESMDGKKIKRLCLEEGGWFHDLVFEYSFCGEYEDHWAVEYGGEKELRRINLKHIAIIEWE